MTFEPVVLFFLLGAIAGLMRSDLKIPGSIYEALSIYLLLAIGLKGGVKLAEHPIGEILGSSVAIVLAGALIPLFAFPCFALHRAHESSKLCLHCSALWFGQCRYIFGSGDFSEPEGGVF